MQISTESHGDIVLLRLQGEANIYHAAELKETLQLALLAYPVIQLDLERVTEVDTSMVQLIAALFMSAAKQGKDVHMTNPGATFIEVVRLCNLQHAFGLEGTAWT